MSVYGSGKFSDKLYGGVSPVTLNTRVSTNILVYDQSGNLKGSYQAGVGNFAGCDFSFNESGCNDFKLYFTDYANILKMDKIQIFIFDNPYPFFLGVVRYIPIKGSGKKDFSYSGIGYQDYLSRVNIGSKTFAGVTIGAALKDIIDNYLYLNTPINKNYGGIDSDLSGITLTSLIFKYGQVSEVLKKLKEIANSTGNEYIVGVDQNANFFFRKKSTELQCCLSVGKYGRYGIPEYSPQDQEETKSKLFVLDKNGTYVTTLTSLEDIDIMEEKLTAPDMNNTDITLWAQGILKQVEQNKRQAKISWKISEYRPQFLIADGAIRIISSEPPTVGDITGTGSLYGVGLYGSGLYGGNAYTGFDIDDTLSIKSVKYILNAGQAIREIQLGSLPIQIDRDMAEISKDIKDLRMSLGV